MHQPQLTDTVPVEVAEPGKEKIASVDGSIAVLNGAGADITSHWNEP